jgi:hypothetical protein
MGGAASRAMIDVGAEMPPEEALLSAAIDVCQHWLECPDPAIRAAFRVALDELQQLIPDGGDQR